MKKLMMFAAAMTIVGGAYAACGDAPEVPELDCALAWDVKISLKSTVPETTKVKTSKVPCGDPITTGGVCYRKPGKYTWDGLLFSCDCECDSILGAEFWLWNKKAKQFVVAGGELEWAVLNVIGKKQQDAEGYFDFESDVPAGKFYAAGFGKWDFGKKSNWLKNLKGEIVGLGEPPVCLDYDCDEYPAVAYLCSDLSEAIEDLPTVFSGKFAIKFNKSMAKKFSKYDEFTALEMVLPKGSEYWGFGGDK